MRTCAIPPRAPAPKSLTVRNAPPPFSRSSNASHSMLILWPDHWVFAGRYMSIGRYRYEVEKKKERKDENREI